MNGQANPGPLDQLRAAIQGFTTDVNAFADKFLDKSAAETIADRTQQIFSAPLDVSGTGLDQLKRVMFPPMTRALADEIVREFDKKVPELAKQWGLVQKIAKVAGVTLDTGLTTQIITVLRHRADGAQQSGARFTEITTLRDVYLPMLAGQLEQPENRRDPSLSSNPSGTRGNVFISYSHMDRTFLDELLTHLKPLERAGRVSAWSDEKIPPGAKWLNDVKNAVDSAKVAVMLVSKDFLASDFINEHELGPLLKKAEQGVVKVRWVCLRACNWKASPLEGDQALLDPGKPLVQMRAKRDAAWVKVCEEIVKAADA